MKKESSSSSNNNNNNPSSLSSSVVVSQIFRAIVVVVVVGGSSCCIQRADAVIYQPADGEWMCDQAEKQCTVSGGRCGLTFDSGWGTFGLVSGGVQYTSESERAKLTLSSCPPSVKIDCNDGCFNSLGDSAKTIKNNFPFSPAAGNFSCVAKDLTCSLADGDCSTMIVDAAADWIVADDNATGITVFTAVHDNSNFTLECNNFSSIDCDEGCFCDGCTGGGPPRSGAVTRATTTTTTTTVATTLMLLVLLAGSGSWMMDLALF